MNLVERLLNYLQRKTADTIELQAAKTILELIERLGKYTEVCERYKELYFETDTKLTIATERLEVAEKQRDELTKELSTARLENIIKYGVSHPEMYKSEYEERLEKQRDELLSAAELYEQALKASWPEGAMGDAFDYWNSARAAIASVKEQK